jgi:hypothetical protein
VTVAAVSEPAGRWKNGLLRRFNQQTARRILSLTGAIRRRTASDLMTLAHARAVERDRLLEAKRVAEVARRKAEGEVNRARHWDTNLSPIFSRFGLGRLVGSRILWRHERSLTEIKNTNLSRRNTEQELHIPPTLLGDCALSLWAQAIGIS